MSSISSPTGFAHPVELPKQMSDIPAAEVFEGAHVSRNPSGPFNMKAGVTFRDDVASRISDGFDDREMPFVMVPFKSASGAERWEPFKLDLRSTAYAPSADHSQIERRDSYELNESLPPSLTIDGEKFGNETTEEGVAFGALTAKGILWAQPSGGNVQLPEWEK
jgi:hypothetical protein